MLGVTMMNFVEICCFLRMLWMNCLRGFDLMMRSWEICERDQRGYERRICQQSIVVRRGWLRQFPLQDLHKVQ